MFIREFGALTAAARAHVTVRSGYARGKPLVAAIVTGDISGVCLRVRRAILRGGSAFTRRWDGRLAVVFMFICGGISYPFWMVFTLVSVVFRLFAVVAVSAFLLLLVFAFAVAII